MNAKVFKKALVCLTLAISFATSSSYCSNSKEMNDNFNLLVNSNDEHNINSDEHNINNNDNDINNENKHEHMNNSMHNLNNNINDYNNINNNENNSNKSMGDIPSHSFNNITINNENNINNDENSENCVKNSNYNKDDYNEEYPIVNKNVLADSNFFNNINQRIAGDQHKNFNNALSRSQQQSMIINNSQFVDNLNKSYLIDVNDELQKKPYSSNEKDLSISKTSDKQNRVPNANRFMIKAHKKKPGFTVQNVNTFNILSNKKWSNNDLQIDHGENGNVEELNEMSDIENSNYKKEYNNDDYQVNNNNVFNFSVIGNNASFSELNVMKQFLNEQYYDKAFSMNRNDVTKEAESITFWVSQKQATITKEQMLNLTNKDAQNVNEFIKLSSEFINLSKSANQFIARFYNTNQSAGNLLFVNDKLLPQNKSGKDNVEYLIDFATQVSLKKSGNPDNAERYVAEFNWLVKEMRSCYYDKKADYLIGSVEKELDLIYPVLHAFYKKDQTAINNLSSTIKQLNSASGKLKKLLVLYQILLFAAEIA